MSNALDSAVVSSTTPGSGTTQTLTVTGVGQITGCLVWVVATDADGETNDMICTVGACGSSGGAPDVQVMCGVTNKDNVDPTVAKARLNAGDGSAGSGIIGGILDEDDGSITRYVRVANKGFGVNTVTLEWQTAPGSGHQVVAVVFGGGALVQVGTATTNVTLNQTTVVNCPNLLERQPECLIMFGVQEARTGTLGYPSGLSGEGDGAAGADAHLAMGFATTTDGTTIKQAGHDVQVQDNINLDSGTPVDTSPGSIVKDPDSGSPRILKYARYSDTEATAGGAEITAMTQGVAGTSESSFTVTTRDLGAAWAFGYVAISTGGSNVFQCIDVELPVASGGASITGWDVTPQLIVMLLSATTYAQLDSEQIGTNTAGSRSFCITDGTSNSHSINLIEENNSTGTSDSRTHYKTNFIWAAKHTGSDGLVANLNSLDATGFTYTSTNWISTTSKAAICLAFGPYVPPADVGSTQRSQVRHAGSEASQVRGT